jgi:hypothetical protein
MRRKISDRDFEFFRTHSVASMRSFRRQAFDTPDPSFDGDCDGGPSVVSQTALPHSLHQGERKYLLGQGSKT